MAKGDEGGRWNEDDSPADLELGRVSCIVWVGLMSSQGSLSGEGRHSSVRTRGKVAQERRHHPPLASEMEEGPQAKEHRHL